MKELILHVSYGYFPRSIGGTETYISALCKYMSRWSHTVVIPGKREEAYTYNGVPVRVFKEGESRFNVEGVPDKTAAHSFRILLEELKPSIVILHGRTSGISYLLDEECKKAGIKSILIYHTGTVSCWTGRLRQNNEVECDGVVETVKCAECALKTKGVNGFVARIGARVPVVVGRLLSVVKVRSQWYTGLRYSYVLQKHIFGTKKLLQGVDVIVVTCNWAKDLVRSNGACESKIAFVRQGVDKIGIKTRGKDKRLGSTSGLVLGYFGRIDQLKGIDCLIDAMILLREREIELLLYGDISGEDGYKKSIRKKLERADNIRVKNVLEATAVYRELLEVDAVIVPSVIKETGPLIAYEALSMGIPLLASNVGGVDELVVDGVNGMLFQAGNATELSQMISDMAISPETLSRLKENARMSRTMHDVADEIESIIKKVLYNVKGS